MLSHQSHYTNIMILSSTNTVIVIIIIDHCLISLRTCRCRTIIIFSIVCTTHEKCRLWCVVINNYYSYA